MVNLKVEKFKAKGSAGEELNRLRGGRIASVERLAILLKIGQKAQKMYAKYCKNNVHGYDLKKIAKGLQFEPDTTSFENTYWIDNKDDKLDAIASYFENGTGIYNVKFRVSNRNRIKPSNWGTKQHPNRLKFRKAWTSPSGKVMGGASSVAGVRPLYMMRRTLKNIQFNRMYLQREIRMELGI